MRNTMKTNPLLARAELGKVKPILFNTGPASEERVFGYVAPKDPEGAREVTSLWKEHTPSAGHLADNRPVPDFKTMNKNAAKSGLTTAKDQPAFRATNMTLVKKFDHTRKPAQPLPSEKDPRHTYGMASAHRTADVARVCGPVEPPMKHLIQGAYQDEWTRQNLAKENKTARQGTYIPPVPTRAAIGHTLGAQRYLQPHHAGEEWKMSKFTKVPAKVTAYMGTNTASQYPEEHYAAHYDTAAEAQHYEAAHHEHVEAPAADEVHC